MRNLLCFGDSNTWGFDPDATAKSPFPVRHGYDVRWTGVLARELGAGWRVIEEGQNGRTTVHDDPFFPARNGKLVLPAVLESHKPLDAVVLMLGTNDLKVVYSVPPGEIATGVGVLAKMIRQSDAGPGGRPPELLLVCPPAAGDLSHLPEQAAKFPDGRARSLQLPAFYKRLATTLNCAFFDAQTVTQPSPVDGVHLDAANHAALGHAIAKVVTQMLPASGSSR